ncbi:MAG: orotate phosphoribosyltransferase [Bdellovibrionaceae bacterium]|nr:orotate phosphoribosyltransferase [Pseudobdellovibrionaceae bacterium]
MSHADLAKKVFQTCHLTGDFLLRSGIRSAEYFDKYRLESNPELLFQIALKMKNLIPSDTQVLAGLEMGGIPIATALSLLTGLPICFVRKAAKEYGTCQFAEGAEIKDKKICIIEDVITSGGQVILSTDDLRASGAGEVNSVLCIINRGGEDAEKKLKQHNLKLQSLFIKSDFN